MIKAIEIGSISDNYRNKYNNKMLYLSNSDIRRIILRYKSVFPMYRFFIHNNQYANEKDYGVPEWRISDFMWEEKINNNLI